MPNFSKIQKRNTIILTLLSALIAVMVIQTTNAQSSKFEKSVGWYTANIKQAQAMNKECRADSNNMELNATPDCVNALHALEISFGVKH